MNALQLLILAGTGFGLYKYFQQQAATAPDVPPDTNADVKVVLPPTKPVRQPTWPMQKGSDSSWVQILQKHLKIKPDGKFGNQTEAALVAKHNVKMVLNEAQFQQLITGAAIKPATVNPESKKKLSAVWLSLYYNEPRGGRGWTLRAIIDQKTIAETLYSMKDNELRAFQVGYNKGFAHLRGGGTLIGDLDKAIIKTSSYGKVIDRLRKL